MLLEQAVARRAITGPAVGVDDDVRTRIAVQVHHHHLLGQDVPGGLRGGQAVDQPLLLLGAHHLGLGAIEGGADHLLVAARLVGAELAGVQQVQLQQPAPGGAAIDLDRGPDRERRGPQRHVLVIGLGGGLAAQVEDLGIGAVLVEVADPVVVGLVVVPDHEPRRGGVGGLQIGVHLVLGVAAAVVVEAVDLAAEVLADVLTRAVGAVRHPVAAPLVDVVAVVEHEVRRLLGHLAIGRVVAALVVLAADDGEAGAVQGGGGGEGRAGPARQAALLAGREAVPVVAAGLEARDLDVDAVAQFGRRHGGPLGDHGLEAAIGGHFPVHRDRGRGHAVADLERLGARRVQITKPSGQGSPEATPSWNGDWANIGWARAWPVTSGIDRAVTAEDAEGLEQAAAVQGVAVEDERHGGLHWGPCPIAPHCDGSSGLGKSRCHPGRSERRPRDRRLSAALPAVPDRRASRLSGMTGWGAEL